MGCVCFVDITSRHSDRSLSSSSSHPLRSIVEEHPLIQGPRYSSFKLLRIAPERKLRTPTVVPSHLCGAVTPLRAL